MCVYFLFPTDVSFFCSLFSVSCSQFSVSLFSVPFQSMEPVMWLCFGTPLTTHTSDGDNCDDDMMQIPYDDGGDDDDGSKTC